MGLPLWDTVEYTDAGVPNRETGSPNGLGSGTGFGGAREELWLRRCPAFLEKEDLSEGGIPLALVERLRTLGARESDVAAGRSAPGAPIAPYFPPFRRYAAVPTTEMGIGGMVGLVKYPFGAVRDSSRWMFAGEGEKLPTLSCLNNPVAELTDVIEAGRLLAEEPKSEFGVTLGNGRRTGAMSSR